MVLGEVLPHKLKYASEYSGLCAVLYVAKLKDGFYISICLPLLCQQ